MLKRSIFLSIFALNLWSCSSCDEPASSPIFEPDQGVGDMDMADMHMPDTPDLELDMTVSDMSDMRETVDMPDSSDMPDMEQNGPRDPLEFVAVKHTQKFRTTGAASIEGGWVSVGYGASADMVFEAGTPAEQTVEVDPNQFTLAVAQWTDQNEFVEAYAISEGGSPRPEYVEKEADGNLLVLGYLVGSTTFGSTNYSAPSGPVNGVQTNAHEGFVVRVRPETKAVEGVVKLDAQSVQSIFLPAGLATHDSGDFSVAGRYVAGVQIPDGPSLDGDGGLVARFTTSGDLMWVRDLDGARDVKDAGNGAVLASFTYRDQAFSVAGTDYAGAATGRRGLGFVKLDAAGNVLWITRFESESTIQMGESLEADSKIYVSLGADAGVSVIEPAASNLQADTRLLVLDADTGLILQEESLPSIGAFDGVLQALIFDEFGILWGSLQVAPETPSQIEPHYGPRVDLGAVEQTLLLGFNTDFSLAYAHLLGEGDWSAPKSKSMDVGLLFYGLLYESFTPATTPAVTYENMVAARPDSLFIRVK